MMHALSPWIRSLSVLFGIAVASQPPGLCAQDELPNDDVFSGPQVGEPLVGFDVRPTLGTSQETTFDPVAAAGDKPILLIFFHQRTRPAFGLTNLLMRFAKSREEELAAAVVLLSDDITDTERWLNSVSRYFPEGTLYGVSPDGIEGPGAYGLNREVTLTVLVGKSKKVIGNFALIQPSEQADAPRIAEALQEALGDEEPIDLAKFSGRQQGDQRMMARGEAMARRTLNSIIAAEGEEAAQAAIADAEKMSTRRGEMGQVLKNVAATMRRENEFADAKTEVAREWLNQLAKSAGPSPELQALLRPVIQKDATAEEVRERAEKLEEYLKANPEEAEVVRAIVKRIVDAGRLDSYGTEEARKYLRKWSEEPEQVPEKD